MSHHILHLLCIALLFLLIHLYLICCTGLFPLARLLTPAPPQPAFPQLSVILFLCGLQLSVFGNLSSPHLSPLRFPPVILRVSRKPWFTYLNDSFKPSDCVCVFLCMLVCLLALLLSRKMRKHLINSPESSVMCDMFWLRPQPFLLKEPRSPMGDCAISGCQCFLMCL